MEKELQRYSTRTKLETLDLSVAADLGAARPLATRPLGPVEVCFRLGDELLRIGREEAAESYFHRGQKLGPRSPLPLEGLGLLAAERGQHEEAARLLSEAIDHGSTSFLAHYMFAAQTFRLASKSSSEYRTVHGETAGRIRAELEKSLALMPDFARAHHLLAIFDLVQQEDPGAAEKHLQRAIQLEPENMAYLLSLAEAQLMREDKTGARRTLDQLRRPYVDAEIRLHAEELRKETEGVPGTK